MIVYGESALICGPCEAIRTTWIVVHNGRTIAVCTHFLHRADREADGALIYRVEVAS